LLAQVRQDAPARWNYPAWWISAVEHAWPDDWQAILAAGNRQAPLTLRVNRRRASVGEYLETLRAAGLDAAQIGPYAVRLAQAVPVERLPGFAAGVVSVQDAGAQCAAPLLEVADGMRVLDACAAPGGKTGHLLELADLELVALESDPVRAARIAGNLERLGLAAGARIVIGDAGAPSAWHDGQPFDRILADLPCTASGIVRRHPDIRWLRRASDIAALAAQQRRLASALWPLVAPGGQLLFVTCSIFPEEGETQAQWFGSAHADAVRLASPGQMLPACADAVAGTDHDGFFYARFQKR
jgi:16S rRNA (cytosine967-C5)-methyltransferase